jgi:hypothetical protein
MTVRFNKTGSENFVLELTVDVCDTPLLAIF